MRFNDAVGQVGWDDAQEFEACVCEQLCKFLLGSLLAAGHHQHIQIDKLREVRLIALGHDAVDENELRVRLRAAADVAQDRVRFFVVPVVDDPLHDVRFAALGH